MSSIYSDSPVYRINKWLTADLREKGVIPAVEKYITEVDTNDAYNDTDTTVTLPFLAISQQTPEMNTPYSEGEYQDLPFGIYTVEQKGGHGQPWTYHGIITYIFYAGDTSTLIEIANLVRDLTGREDWSAKDVNHFYRTDSTYPFDFKEVCFVSGTGPAPASDEGGRHKYMCIVEYDSTYEGVGRNVDYNDTIGLSRMGNENGTMGA